MIRIDISADGTSELSWSVAAGFRGRGLGKIMVTKALEHTQGRVLARIKVTNFASIAIAKACGFELQSERSGLSTWLRPA